MTDLLYTAGLGLAVLLLVASMGLGLRGVLQQQPGYCRHSWGAAFAAGVLVLAVTTLHLQAGHGAGSAVPMAGEQFARAHPAVLVLLLAVVVALFAARRAERRAAAGQAGQDSAAQSSGNKVP